MNEVQQTAMKLMENQIQNVGFTPIQALTMCLSYYKGGFYEELNDQEFEGVIKAFVAEGNDSFDERRIYEGSKGNLREGKCETTSEGSDTRNCD